MYDHVNYVLRQFDPDRGLSDDCDRTGECKIMCPHHVDDKPSLHVTVTRDRQILLHCFAGCDTADVLKECGLEWEDLKSPVNGRASLSLTGRVYADFISQLPISELHAKDLLQRGLTLQDAMDNGYCSLTHVESQRAVQRLQQRYTVDEIGSVPGFGTGDPVLVDGLVIPVRDWTGRISALQVRQYNREPKYIWFSGKRTVTDRILSAPVHVRFDADTDRMVITEGALKADVLSHFLPGYTVVGVPGVSAWQRLFLVGSQVGKNVRRVYVAFDQDWTTNNGVRTALRQVLSELRKTGRAVSVVEWPAELGKGFDDYLVKQPDQWEAEEAGEWLVNEKQSGRPTI